MPWMIGSTFTPYAVTTTSQQTGFEKEWLPLVDEHPLIRTWRSSSGAIGQDIICWFGGVAQFGGIMILNLLNIPSLKIGFSVDGVNYHDINTLILNTFTPIPVTKHWQYYRYAKVTTSGAASHILIRIEPQIGVPYHEIGSIVFPQFVAWPRAPREGLREGVTREYEKVGNSVAVAGPQYLEQEMNFLLESGTELGVKEFATIGEHTPFAVFENKGVTSQAALMRYEGKITFERYRKYNNISNVKFRELV